MSAYVLNKENIEILTAATDAVIQAAKQYGGSYPLNPETLDVLGGLDMHNLYRFIYIMNIKAVNGRYGEDEKTLPKYTGVRSWGSAENADNDLLRQAIGIFSCYMYQCTDDPVYNSKEWFALNDVRKLLTMIYCSKTIGWGDN